MKETPPEILATIQDGDEQYQNRLNAEAESRRSEIVAQFKAKDENKLAQIENIALTNMTNLVKAAASKGENRLYFGFNIPFTLSDHVFKGFNHKLVFQKLFEMYHTTKVRVDMATWISDDRDWDGSPSHTITVSW